ncbi:TolC family protein [Candidatus Zixiibacteriota bacterium]
MMNLIKYPVIILALLGVIGLGRPASAQETLILSLYDALIRAIEHNESYLIAEEEKARADARVGQARAEALPNLRFFGDYTRNFEIPEQFVTIGDQTERFKFGYEHSANWGFSATQSIFKGGRVFAAWAAARLYAKYIDQGRRQAFLDLQQGVATAFFNAILAEQQVEVARQSLELATETRNVVQKKFDQGQISEYDLLRAEVQVANIRPRVLQAENGRKLSLTNLRNLLGIEAGVPLALNISYPDSASWETESLEDLVQRSRNSRPEPQQAELEVAMREKAVTVARAEHYPSLELSGSYSVSAYREQLGFDHWQRSPAWNARLSLSIPIFEGMRISAGVTQAKVDLTQARLRERSINKLVTLEVEKARNDFLEAQQRLGSQAETVRQAEKGYEISQLRYQEGVGTQLEVTDAMLALTTARLNKSNALRDYLVARADLRRSVGEPVLDALGSYQR